MGIWTNAPLVQTPATQQRVEPEMPMPLTRSFREIVAKRAARDPEFRAMLVEEAEQVLAEGDVETARRLLRYLAPPEPEGGPADGGDGPKPSP